jgi:hypothetical protein
VANGTGGFSGPFECVPKKPVGSPCDEWNIGIECQTWDCYEGTCSCRPLSKNSGCPENQTCLGEDSSHPAWRGPFHCASRKSIGSACTNFSDCDTGNCFEGFCQCSVGYDSFGCQDTEYCVGTAFVEDEWSWLGPFRCEARKDTGLACENGWECLSGQCAQGICQRADYSFSSCIEDVITTISDVAEPSGQTETPETADPSTVEPNNPTNPPQSNLRPPSSAQCTNDWTTVFTAPFLQLLLGLVTAFFIATS